VLGVQVGPQLGYGQELLVTYNTWGGICSTVEHEGGMGGREVRGEGVGGQYRGTKMTL